MEECSPHQYRNFVIKMNTIKVGCEDEDHQVVMSDYIHSSLINLVI